MGEFVHLHLHTEYSLLDGGNQIEKLVDRVAELGMRACAITDHGNIFGAVAFYEACRAKGIKPILGVEAYVTPPGKPRSDRTYSGGGEGGYHLVLLAMDNTGWKNLLVLCSEAYLTGFYYKPRIDRELLAKHSAGLIAINGHLGSEIGDHLLAYERSGDEKHWALARESAEWHKRVFGGGVAEWRSGEAEAKCTAAPRHQGTEALPRFFIELQRHVPEQNAINGWLIKLAREVGAPLVCDNDAHFLREEDHDSHDTLICISTGKGKNDQNRMRYPRELFVKSPAQMQEMFGPGGEWGEAGVEALINSVRIARACNVELPLGANHAPLVRVKLPAKGKLPRHDDPAFGGDLTAWYRAYCAGFELLPFRNEDGSDPTDAQRAKAKADCDAALRMLAEAGFVWRYGREVSRGGGDADADLVAKVARLDRELEILANKNISAYFLIVWDFVNWGRNNGVPALARGSGVGTMVGYALGLSNACPVRYGLLFERFTDPDRSEYPDIDIDLCQDGRQRVIDYVRQKYGHVAQIITFGTLKARAAIKDVGRVLEIPLAEVDRISKLVPEQLGITIKEAIEQEPELKGMAVRDPRIRELLDQAMALEGHTRHAGVHAAGVIVATRALQEIVPLYKQTGSEAGDVITQWDGPTCEKMGLLKMDFLGLRTISVVERAKRLIRETMTDEETWAAVGRLAEHEQVIRWRGEEVRGAAQPSPAHLLTSSPAHPLDLDRLSFDDQTVFELFRRGETTGVFQFESGGMRRLLVEMKPDRLEDLIAANALFRPGPMDLIPDYNRRKHGTEDVPRVHEVVDRYTSETYGVMVYQEQVMQIVHGLGGIKLRDAYSLIKNISKKKHDKIEKERPKFIEGAVRQGLTKDGANDLFELILKFAGYGFNKSHSTGYAIVAYQTAYLKTYFPHQYMAAFLTYESQASKVSDWIPYLEDCRRTRVVDPSNGQTVGVGVEVKPPDINLSRADFAVVGGAGTGHSALGTGKGRVGASTTSSASAECPVPNASRHIRFGLKAIKGAGEKAIEAIIAEREKGGAFASLFDFCERIVPGVVTRPTLEALVKCGAFDAVHGREQRSAMLASVEAALNAGASLAADKAMGQGGLFVGGGNGPGDGPAKKNVAAPTVLAKTGAWTEAEALAFEKEVLGFYVSSHPLERWRFWAGAFASADTATIKNLTQDARVVLPAMIQSVRPIVVRNGRSAGQKMAILTVEDHAGACDCVLFTDAFAKYGHLAEPEKVLFVLGRLDLSRGDPQVVVDRLVPIDGVPFDQGKVRLFVDEMRLNGAASATMSRVRALLGGAGAGMQVEVKASGDGAAGVGGAASLSGAASASGGRVAGASAPNGHAKVGAAPAQGKGAGGAMGASSGAASGAGAHGAGGAGMPGEQASRFPIEVIIGTQAQVVVVQSDARLRVALSPDLVKSLQGELGDGMVRVVGGFTLEKDKPKPWEKKKRGGGEEE
jgi:DNA polymerase-3 subunit alpha